MFSNENNSSRNKIVLSIPLPFEERQIILDSLAHKYGNNYLWTGKFFQDLKAKKYCEIETITLTDVDRHNLIDFYRDLRSEKVSNREIEEINNCSQIVYLTSYKLGWDACVKMAEYARIFLTLGGIFTIVNSTGVIRSRDKWLASSENIDVFELYSLFVNLIEGDLYYYSCGMHNFGKADVSLDLTEDLGLANYVMNVFNYYRLTESVILKEGETFQPDLECPMYRLNWQKCDRSQELNNPDGKWHLSRVEDNLDVTYQVT